jgi:rSAM/selenodomain-associated transferase 1
MKRMVLAQYAKWPKLGHVKTRIAKDLGDQRALEIHYELLHAILCRFNAENAIAYQLWLDSIDHHQATDDSVSKRLARLIESKNIVCRQQQGSDLGRRMSNTLKTLSSDYEQVAIIGSDCPNVTTKDLQQVSSALDNHDLVLIPAEDGGYVLLAMRSIAINSLSDYWLDGIDWGTSEVLAETLRACKMSGLSAYLLPESWDVDEVVDYKRWKES